MKRGKGVSEGLHWLVGGIAGELPRGYMNPNTVVILPPSLSLSLPRLHSPSVRLPCSPSPQVHPIGETHARHMDPEAINTRQSPALPSSAIRIKLSCLYFLLSLEIFLRRLLCILIPFIWLLLGLTKNTAQRFLVLKPLLVLFYLSLFQVLQVKVEKF